MKVLMCNSFYYLRGGAERCVFDLSQLLLSHGHEVIPFAMEHPENRPSQYSHYFVSHVDFPSHLGKRTKLGTKLGLAGRSLYSREARQKIEQLIADEKPDIAHLHGIAHEISPSILPAIREAGIPIVQTLHDYALLCPNTNFLSHGLVCERCKKRKYYNAALHRCKRGSLSASLLACIELYVQKLLRIYERSIDLFVSPSRFLRDKLVEYGIRNRVVHLANFVDLERFRPGDGAGSYLLYFGRLSREKGVKTLLSAMTQLEQVPLYVAGTGELYAPLRDFARSHHLSNVSFLGHLSTEDLIPLIQGASCVIVPSEWYENYPMSVLESLACGTPVIASSIGGIPEMVKDGETGLLFAPGNPDQLAEKIRVLREDPRQARAMGRNGRQQVASTNSPESYYHRVLHVYERLLDRDSAACDSVEAHSAL